MEAQGPDSSAPDTVREQAIAWLVRLRAGPTDREIADFEDWYAANPLHADVYDALLDTWDDTARVSQVPAARRESQPTAQRPWVRIAVAAAAVLLVLIAGSLALTRAPSHDPASEGLFAARIGEIREIALEDGSRLTLDTESRVRILYTEKERRLLLEHGRARFEVAHDSRRPFVVIAGTREVVAHGTIFDVDLRQQRAIVALLEGAVEVRQPAAAEVSTKSTMLRPGQQLAIGDAESAPVPVAINASQAGWPSGMLSFADAPLVEVVAAANRYSRTQIVLGDRAIAARRFTGTFKVGEPMALADMIGSMFGPSVEKNSDGNIVLTTPQ